MRYLPEVRPAGLLVIEPEELAWLADDLVAGTELLLLALAELVRSLQPRS